MALSPGTKLGQYEVRELIGAGGMGEVYRAHDSKLERDVAIKILPALFARDPDRLARFKREAKLLASLNHPNIATIHGLEESNGTHFLVMELVPGETLHDRVGRDGPFPIDEALDITGQIAAALEHAHEKTIIHRDLKPANVKLTPEGNVKVLDFGLAKAFAGAASTGESPTPVIDSNSPTLSKLPEGYMAPGASPTIPGVILGTAAYMSPEQAKGKTVDRRTDIWALGAVLYELLTGQGAFHRPANQSRDREGAGPRRNNAGVGPLANARGSDSDEPDTVQEIIARVLQAEPDWTLLPADTPQSIRALLRRCLQKDSKQRFSSASDVGIIIEDALASPAVSAPTVVAQAPAPRRWLLYAGACVLAALAAAAAWLLKPTPPTVQQVSRTVIPLPANGQLTGTITGVLALSPDGTRLAYVAAGTGGQQLYLRKMDALEATPIAGTEGASNPFFSPDSQWIAFFAGGSLKKVSASGGAVLSLCNSGPSRGGTWGPNDSIVFNPGPGTPLSQVSAAGGEPQALTKLNPGELEERWPHFLPDGKAILLTTALTTDSNVEVQRLDTGERKVLIRGGSDGRYVPTGPSAGLPRLAGAGTTGDLVYYRSGTMMAVPFDPVRLEVQGNPAPALEGIMPANSPPPAGQFSFSSTGSLAYVPGSSAQAIERTLAWVDRKGAAQPIAAPPRAYGQPHLSPDGRQLATILETEGNGGDIWIYDLARGTLTRLTFDGGSANLGPVWTPDGKRIVFRSLRRGVRNLFWKLADGTGAEEQLTKREDAVLNSPYSISPDGRMLFFAQNPPATHRDIWVMPLDGERKPSLFLQTPYEEAVARISPDGRWLAYISNESGRYEVYVRPFPSASGKWQISTEGGGEPLWSRNGRELFYRTGDKVMAVDITSQPAFQAGTPRMLFEGKYAVRSVQPETNFDVSPDGQRFLMIKEGGAQGTSLTQINVVQNWFEELKQKVPVK